ncbi:MAG: HAD hydrolase family protein [Clostridia bacterium]|nr:HAD hydrolase family protein [Clostridia bacterium]
MITNKSLPHAIFLDIDGTLMDHGSTTNLGVGDIPERNLSAIREAQSLGHKIIVNTGRGYACLPNAVINAELDGFITGLGSLVEIEGRTVFNCPVPDDLLFLVTDYCINHKIPVRAQGKTIRMCFDPDELYGNDYWLRFRSVSEFREILGNNFISKLTFDNVTDSTLIKMLNRNFNLYMHSDSSGEATSKGCNKARAMQIATDVLDIPRERTIAMGDSVNDMEMLLGAGTSVALDNASEKIKKMCDYITSSCTDGGVGRAIELLLL